MEWKHVVMAFVIGIYIVALIFIASYFSTKYYIALEPVYVEHGYSKINGSWIKMGNEGCLPVEDKRK